MTRACGGAGIVGAIRTGESLPYGARRPVGEHRVDAWVRGLLCPVGVPVEPSRQCLYGTSNLASGERVEGSQLGTGILEVDAEVRRSISPGAHTFAKPGDRESMGYNEDPISRMIEDRSEGAQKATEGIDLALPTRVGRPVALRHDPVVVSVDRTSFEVPRGGLVQLRRLDDGDASPGQCDPGGLLGSEQRAREADINRDISKVLAESYCLLDSSLAERIVDRRVGVDQPAGVRLALGMSREDDRSHRQTLIPEGSLVP